MEFSREKGKASLPSISYGTRPWHELLYELKKKHKDRFPELECIGDFDWDGPYPTVRAWHEIQTSLCISGACLSVAGATRILLNPECLRIENPLKNNADLLEAMFRVALTMDNFFEAD